MRIQPWPKISTFHLMSSRGGPSSSSGSRVIFIGNIPFEGTEEQLIDIFKEVGPVQSFRLMFDRETGRSRGYAFCEYADAETASSAIRNLNGYDLNGRSLKVDRADNEMLPSQFGGGAGGGSSYRDGGSHSSAALPTHLRPAQNLPGYGSTTTSTGAIHSILSAPPFNTPQNLMEALVSLKSTVQSNPEQARHLLSSNPALAYALLQSFLVLNLVDMSTVQSLLLQATQQTAQSSDSSAPSGPSTASPASAINSDQQRALIMQIMNMTQEQINQLPSQQRDQVLQVKQQILMQQQQQQLRR